MSTLNMFKLLLAATKALTVTLLMPVFGMLWGYTFLNEVITPQMIFGTVLILIGTFGVVQKKQSESVKAS